MSTKKKPAPPPVEEPPAPKVDKRLCRCEGVQRRYDGDGPPTALDGVNHYPCAVCGKLYA